MKPSHYLVLPLIRREVPGWGRLYRWFVGGYKHDSKWQGQKRTIRGKLHGYQMELDLSKWSERITFFLGRYYDLELQQLVQGLLRPGDRFVDVGANLGMISLLAANRVGPTGLVDSIEPNPACATRLHGTLQANSIRQVRLHQMGAGDADAELDLTIPKFNAGEASLTRFKGVVDDSAFDHVTVPIRTVDSMLAYDPRSPILIKVDVEGYECFALRGMKETLQRHLPLVVTEVAADFLRAAGSTPGELNGILQGLGYKGWSISSVREGMTHRIDLLPINPESQFDNVLWIPPQGTARQRFLESFPGLARTIQGGDHEGVGRSKRQGRGLEYNQQGVGFESSPIPRC